MKKKLVVGILSIGILLVFLFSATIGSHEVQGSEDTRIHPASDLVYEGAFKIDKRFISGLDVFRNEANEPVLAVTKSDGTIYQYTVPSLVVTNNVKELNTVSVYKQYSDVTEGKFNVDGEITGKRLGAVKFLDPQGSQTEGKIYWNRYEAYADAMGYYPMGWSDQDDSSLDASGLWKIDPEDGSDPGFWNRFLLEAPHDKADSYFNSRYLVTGRIRRGGLNGGPTLHAVAPWNYGNPPSNETIFDSTTLLNYRESPQEDLTVGDMWPDAVWIDTGDKEAFIFAGKHSANYGCYAKGGLPDLYSSNSGYHAWGRHSELMFMDPSDLIAVANGTMQPHEPQPYARMHLENRVFDKHWSPQGGGNLSGIAFDSKAKKLYVAENKGGVVHVYSLRSTDSSADTTEPTTPTIKSAISDGSTITLDWEPSSDATNDIFYTVYRRAGKPDDLSGLDWGRYSEDDTSLIFEGHILYGDNTYTPIAQTTKTSYQDDKAIGYFSGVGGNGTAYYKVEARDTVNNTSSSTISIQLDGSDSSTTTTDTVGQCGTAFGMGWTQQANDVTQTSDGGFILAGKTKGMSFKESIHADHATPDAYVVKTDASGTKQWETIIGKAGTDITSVHTGIWHYYNANSVLEVSDGYLVTGTKSTADRNKELFVIKLDTNGTFQWEKNYGGTSEDNFRTDLIPTNDGNYVFSSWSKQYGGCYVVKIDGNGNKLWTRSYNNGDCKDITQTSDGGFILTGHTWAYSDDNDVYLLKLDNAGNKEWDNGYVASGGDTGYDVVEAYDGGYLVVGKSAAGGSTYNNIHLLKTDSSGNEQWRKTHGGTDGNSHRAAEITKHNNNYIIGGYTYSFGTYNGLLLAIDSSGNKLWIKPFGNDNEEYVNAMSKTDNNNFALAGYSLSFTTAFDMYLTEVDTQGNCVLNTECSASGTYYYDKDYDGYGTETTYLGGNQAASLCINTSGYVKNNTDCNDTNADANPGATEQCGNGIDDDCDGNTDVEDSECEAVVCGNGVCDGDDTCSTCPTDCGVCTVSDTGLIGHWSFDSINGDTVPDESGNGNAGTLAGGPGVVSGKVGQALSFDGVDDYVTIPDNGLSFTDGSGNDKPFSISAWVYMENSTSFPMLSKSGDGGAKQEYNFVTGSDSRLTMYTYESDSFEYAGRETSDISGYENQWIHVVGTYNGGESVDDFKVYINGTRSDNANHHSGLGDYAGMNDKDYPVRIGLQKAHDKYAQGKIDEVRIYNRVLSEAEAKGLYNGASTTTSPGLAGDITGDGRVDVDDFGALINHWMNQNNFGNADLNSDNTINLQDLGILMSNWGN